jgi:hypothetical protein
MFLHIWGVYGFIDYCDRGQSNQAAFPLRRPLPALLRVRLLLAVNKSLFCDAIPCFGLFPKGNPVR